MQWMYKDAVGAAQNDLENYRNVGIHLGKANCIWSLARTYGGLHRNEDGEHVALEAMASFGGLAETRVGRVVGIPWVGR